MSPRNITKLDMVCLVLLYNISYECLAQHGWYFLNKNILNKSSSAIDDINEIRAVCKLANLHMLDIKPERSISQHCFSWFRNGFRFVVPKLNDLIAYALHHPMGYYNYTSYIGNSHIALLSTLSTETK